MISEPKEAAPQDQENAEASCDPRSLCPNNPGSVTRALWVDITSRGVREGDGANTQYLFLAGGCNAAPTAAPAASASPSASPSANPSASPIPTPTPPPASPSPPKPTPSP